MLVAYKDGEIGLEGYFAKGGRGRPLVILCHAWRGRDLFICEKAAEVASWGYNAFALDMYGKGVLGNSKAENGALKKPFIEDRQLLKRRVLKGFEIACGLPDVDSQRVVVLGFGFGALCALDLARAGVPLKGAISVYGHYDYLPEGLPITSKLLCLHGLEDPISPVEDLIQFQRTYSSIDCQIELYSQTLHAFANPTANDADAGLLYNPFSAKRAWNSIQRFLKQTLI